LWWLMSRALRGLLDRTLIGVLVRAGCAAVIMGGAVYGFTQVFADLPNIVLVLGGALIGIIVFEGAALVFRIDEARTIPLAFLRRVRR
jgi:hypothetical protein